MINFPLTPEQESKFQEWAKTQPKYNSRQAGDIGAEPYEFIFVRTNCGLTLRVKNVINNEEIDLTEWDSF